MLLVVAALALPGGPMAGVQTGFLAGLALDVAPPGSHLVGQNALVFSSSDNHAGRWPNDVSGDSGQGQTAPSEIVANAVCAPFGEAAAGAARRHVRATRGSRGW